MPYVCFNCGEKDRFYKESRFEGNINRDATMYIEGETGKVREIKLDGDEIDSSELEENLDYQDSVKCNECDEKATEVKHGTWERWEDGYGVEEQEGFNKDLNMFEEEIKEEGAISKLKRDLTEGKKISNTRKCFFCEKEIGNKIVICPHCGKLNR